MTTATLGLVDSGASCSMFPADWAEQLGINLDNDCEIGEANTAGGVSKPHFYEPGVDALILGRKIHLSAVFQPKLDVILLGRDDFFKEFHVSFDQRAATFRLKSYETDGNE